MTSKRGVILVGHGSIPKDCPKDIITRFKTAEAKRRASGGEPTAEERELDAVIRGWPRTPGSDPYREGIDRLAEELSPLLDGTRLATAYNEFCAPSVAAAVEEMVEDGIQEITVVPTMLTPGGVHSEVDIPQDVERLRAAYPGIRITYAWPFDLVRLAEMLAAHLRTQQAMEG